MFEVNPVYPSLKSPLGQVQASSFQPGSLAQLEELCLADPGILGRVRGPHTTWPDS